MIKRKFMVVGGCGPLGSEIVQRLLAAGHEVWATFRTPREDMIAKLDGLGAKVAQLDLDLCSRSSVPLPSDVDGFVFTPILTVSAKAASMIGSRQSAIFFSSNNVAIDETAPVWTRS